MKILYLIKGRIAQYFQKNKFIFVLFILGGILNSFVLSCFFGEAQTLIQTIVTPEAGRWYRSYSIAFFEEGQVTDYVGQGSIGHPFVPGEQKYCLTVAQAEELSKSALLEEVVVSFKDPQDFNSLETASAFVKGGNTLYSSNVYGDEVLEFARGSIKYGELKDDEIILNGTTKKVGDIYSFRGKEFRVAAVISNGSSHYITLNAMKEISMGTVEGIVVISKETHDREDDPVVDLFQKKFVEYDIVYSDLTYPTGTSFGESYYLHRPDIYEKSEGLPEEILQGYYERLALVFCCYFVSQLSFLILLHYLLKSMAGDNAIYLIVGFKKWKLLCLIFLECVVLSVIPIILGLMLHKVFSRTIFQHITSVFYLAKSFNDYLFLFLFMIIITFVVLIPFVLFSYFRSPIDLKRKKYSS